VKPIKLNFSDNKALVKRERERERKKMQTPQVSPSKSLAAASPWTPGTMNLVISTMKSPEQVVPHPFAGWNQSENNQVEQPSLIDQSYIQGGENLLTLPMLPTPKVSPVKSSIKPKEPIPVKALFNEEDEKSAAVAKSSVKAKTQEEKPDLDKIVQNALLLPAMALASGKNEEKKVKKQAKKETEKHLGATVDMVELKKKREEEEKPSKKKKKREKEEAPSPPPSKKQKREDPSKRAPKKVLGMWDVARLKGQAIRVKGVVGMVGHMMESPSSDIANYILQSLLQMETTDTDEYDSLMERLRKLGDATKNDQGGWDKVDVESVGPVLIQWLLEVAKFNDEEEDLDKRGENLLENLYDLMPNIHHQGLVKTAAKKKMYPKRHGMTIFREHLRDIDGLQLLVSLMISELRQDEDGDFFDAFKNHSKEEKEEEEEEED
jgi:hypothetical protein